MNEEQVTVRILELSRARFGAKDLAAGADLFEALGIDSVQALELLSDVERTFSVELPDYEMAEVRSFADLASRIAERL